MSGIMVNEVNDPPVWPRLPDVRVPANATFSFAVAASDPDLPTQTITVRLSPMRNNC